MTENIVISVPNIHTNTHTHIKSTDAILEDRLRRQHCTVNLQDLLLLDEVLPPGLQDVVLQGASHGAKVVQAAHTWGVLLHGHTVPQDYAT